VDGFGGIRVLDVAAIRDRKVRHEIFASSNLNRQLRVGLKIGEAHHQLAKAPLDNAVLSRRHRFLVKNAIDVVAGRLIGCSKVFFD
jgi:hypothetical protein